MSKMRTIDRMNLIGKIGRELISKMSYSDIKVYLGSFGIYCNMRFSRRYGNLGYIKKILYPQSEDIIVKISKDLKLERVHKIVAPSDSVNSKRLAQVNSSTIKTTWHKALERRTTDPDGAITSARTLLEDVCKHILDEDKILYQDKDDLPKLYGLVASHLNLSPSQHTDLLFKRIFGGCCSVVEGLGALRNKLSDAHGRGKVSVKTLPRHAELAVNLAGTMSTFILATWEQKRSESE